MLGSALAGSNVAVISGGVTVGGSTRVELHNVVMTGELAVDVQALEQLTLVDVTVHKTSAIDLTVHSLVKGVGDATSSAHAHVRNLTVNIPNGRNATNGQRTVFPLILSNFSTVDVDGVTSLWQIAASPLGAVVSEHEVAVTWSAGFAEAKFVSINNVKLLTEGAFTTACVVRNAIILGSVTAGFSPSEMAVAGCLLSAHGTASANSFLAENNISCSSAVANIASVRIQDNTSSFVDHGTQATNITAPNVGLSRIVVEGNRFPTASLPGKATMTDVLNDKQFNAVSPM